MSLPPQLEDIQEKLAENIHELWAMDKIDLGWTYGPVGRVFNFYWTVLAKIMSLLSIIYGISSFEIQLIGLVQSTGYLTTPEH